MQQRFFVYLLLWPTLAYLVDGALHSLRPLFFTLQDLLSIRKAIPDLVQ